MPVDNNEHERIDDVSTDHISYGTLTRDSGFHIVTRELFDCFVQASQCSSLLVVTCRCELHDLAMY